MKKVLALTFNLVLGLLVIGVILTSYVPRTIGATIYVPGDYSTIQAAISAAASNDVIIVAKGEYYEHVNFGSKNLTLTSTDPDDPDIVEQTIINGGGTDTVVTFAGGGTGSVLAGFTLTNGRALKGGGIVCGSSSPDIINCIISNNTATSIGGGIYCGRSLANITGCTITGNSADKGGGLCWEVGSAPVLTNCLITENSATSYGGGMYAPMYGGTIEIINCTVSKNSVPTTGRIKGSGGLYCVGWGVDATITNCIFYGDLGGEIKPGGMEVTYSDVEGGYYHPSLSNIGDDPLFKDSGDYHLTSGSPCIDAGTNSGAPAQDKDGKTRPLDGDGNNTSICDMGAYEFELPNLIELDSFSAVSRGDKIAITWTTLSEIDTAGFNLWCAHAQDGKYSLVNPTLIESVGGPALSADYSYADNALPLSADYSYADNALPLSADNAYADNEYYYQLEEVDNRGGSTFYGPVSVIVPANSVEESANYSGTMIWWPPYIMSSYLDDYFSTWNPFPDGYIYGYSYYYNLP